MVTFGFSHIMTCFIILLAKMENQLPFQFLPGSFSVALQHPEINPIKSLHHLFHYFVFLICKINNVRTKNFSVFLVTSKLVKYLKDIIDYISY